MSGMTPLGTMTAANSAAAPLSRARRRQARDTALAAGVLCVTPTGLALFLLRSPESSQGGTWCIPGGGLDEGEDAETAALRELEEETGHKLGTRINQIHQFVSAEGVDFTTFEAVIDESFAVTLDDEHVGFCWAPLDMPPQPLHPGCSAVFKDFMESQEDNED